MAIKTTKETALRRAIEARWSDFGFRLSGIRPTLNESEDDSSWLADAATLQPLFHESLALCKGLDDAISSAKRHLVDRPDLLRVEINILVGPKWLGIGTVAWVRREAVVLENPPRLAEHEQKKTARFD